MDQKTVLPKGLKKNHGILGGSSFARKRRQDGADGASPIYYEEVFRALETAGAVKYYIVQRRASR